MKTPGSATAGRSLSDTAGRSGPVPSARPAPRYDADFIEWTRHTAELMRQHRFDELDIEHAAEEIEDMGTRDIRELCSRTEVLLVHLLQWKFQATRRSRSWRATMRAQRSDILKLLGQSPSLRQRLSADLRGLYAAAVKLAADESGLHRDRFPTACPFSVDEILDDEFLPS
jgi:hypothetical protein